MQWSGDEWELCSRGHTVRYCLPWLRGHFARSLLHDCFFLWRANISAGKNDIEGVAERTGILSLVDLAGALGVLLLMPSVRSGFPCKWLDLCDNAYVLKLLGFGAFQASQAC